MRITSHGIEFIRTGECRQCGACGCGECPHHYEQGNKHWCAVYDRRHMACAPCGEAHAGCIEFPDNPWIYVVRDGACGYTFERADGGPMNELPFLNGKPWRRHGDHPR